MVHFYDFFSGSNVRVAVAMCTHCWFKYFNSALWNKNGIKADSVLDAGKLYGKKANVYKYFQDIPVHMINQPGYSSTYDQSSDILKSG